MREKKILKLLYSLEGLAVRLDARIDRIERLQADQQRNHGVASVWHPDMPSITTVSTSFPPVNT